MRWSVAGTPENVSMTGALLAGRYRLEEPIASGGMGEVWRATDTVLRRRVAVKILSDQLAHDTAFLTRFRHEARTMAALRHPGIADVYDYGECTPEHPAYLAMAFIDGQPLSRYIAAAGRLGPAETAALVAQVARALHAAHHTGVIHRDIKPGNLILRSDGTVVLVDFGVAYTGRSPTLTDVNEVVGTAMYMAPEQAGKQPLTAATDIYALGAVAYHCLAGYPPFDGDSALTIVLRHLTEEPPPLPTDVPLPLRQLVTTAMAKDPAERYPSAAALARAAAGAVPPVPEPRPDGHPLRAAAAGIASAMTGIMPAIRTPRAVRARRRLVTAATGALGAFVFGAALAMANAPAARQQTVRPNHVPHTVASKPVQAAPSAPSRHAAEWARTAGSGTGSDRGGTGAGTALSPQSVSEHTVPSVTPRPSPSPTRRIVPPTPTTSPTASPSVTSSPSVQPSASTPASSDPGGGAQTTPSVSDSPAAPLA